MSKWLARFFKPVLMAALEVGLSMAIAKAKQKIDHTDKVDAAGKAFFNAVLDETVANAKAEVDKTL